MKPTLRSFVGERLGSSRRARFKTLSSIYTPSGRVAEWRCTTGVMRTSDPTRALGSLEVDDLSPIEDSDSVHGLVRHPDIFKHNLQMSPDSYVTQHDIWYPAIESYSARVQHSSGGTYGAGMWKEDLQNGLGWYVVGNRIGPYFLEEHHNRTGEYIAPSWSWAPIHGMRVTFCTFKYNLVYKREKSIRPWTGK
jgi:hypothetical protein